MRQLGLTLEWDHMFENETTVVLVWDRVWRAATLPQPPTFIFASCLTPTVVRTATPTPVGRLAMGEQRKAGSADCSVRSSISSPWRSRWKEGGPREEREAASRRTITAGGSGRKETHG